MGKKKSEGQVGLWHFRVHYEPYKPEDVVTFVKERANMIIAVRETASRPHIHMVIVKFKQTKSTFVQQFLNKFPEYNGNGSYSCSKKDDLEAQTRYCLKGESKETKPEILYHKEGLDCDKYHQDYWSENERLVAEAKAKYQPKGSENDLAKKPKTKSWTEKVYDEMVVQYPSEVMTIQTYQLLYKPSEVERSSYNEARFILFRHVKRAFGKAIKKISPRIIQEIFDGMINAILGDEYSEKADRIMFNQLYN